jgi:hypothetical protein
MRIGLFLGMTALMLAGTAFFVQGLRTRKAIAGQYLFIDRDRSPVRYWIVQFSYLCAMACFGGGAWLGATGRSVQGKSVIDKLIMSTWGLTFLSVSVVMGIIFLAGLRSGAADTRFGNVMRSKTPIRYWAVEAAYVVIGCMTAILGLGVFVIVLLK